jgi:hypothetical protein
MDVLLNNDNIRDDRLASGIGINPKELQKVCGRLRGQGFVFSSLNQGFYK